MSRVLFVGGPLDGERRESTFGSILPDRLREAGEEYRFVELVSLTDWRGDGVGVDEVRCLFYVHRDYEFRGWVETLAEGYRDSGSDRQAKTRSG